MKLRFFLFSFTILFAFTIVAFLSDRYLINKQFEDQIDSQLETMAASIIASNLSPDLLQNFESTDDIIRDALEDQRIDRTIRIFSADGKMLFSNDMGDSIDENMSHERWNTIVAVGRELRTLTLYTNGYVLEIGMFIPHVKPISLHKTYSMILFIFIFSILTILSYWVASYSIRPLERLNSAFNYLKAKFLSDSQSSINQTPEAKTLKEISSQNDEVGALAKDMSSLFEHLEELQETYKKDLYFLAHELKTPLAKMVFVAENISYSPKETQNFTAESDRIKKLCKKMALFIDQYLQIASLRNQRVEKLNIQALPMLNLLSELIDSTFSTDKHRIQIFENRTPFVEVKNRTDSFSNESSTQKSEGNWFAEKSHLEAIIINLLSNALKYSDGSVSVFFTDISLYITDDGPGLSTEAQEKFGRAFNRSNRPDSTGLGIAYVKSICELYSWSLTYRRESNKSIFIVSIQ